MAFNPIIASLVIQAALKGLSALTRPKPKRVPGFLSGRGFFPERPGLTSTALDIGGDAAGLFAQFKANQVAGNLQFNRQQDLLTQQLGQGVVNQTPNPVTGVVPTDTLGAEIEANIAKDFVAGGQLPDGRLIQDVRKDFADEAIGERELTRVQFAKRQADEAKIQADEAKIPEVKISDVETKLIAQNNKKIDRELKFISSEKKRIKNKFIRLRKNTSFIKNNTKRGEKLDRLDRMEQTALRSLKLTNAELRVQKLRNQIDAIFAKFVQSPIQNNDPLGIR